MPNAGSSKDKYVFSTPGGLRLLRRILRARLPYDPHDYQLEGVAKSLDGIDLLSVLATRSGKTAYYTMFIIALLELQRDPALTNPLNYEVPQDPVLIVAFPTLSLEEEMEHTFTSLGLKSLVINHRTVAAARQRRRNLWTTAQTDVSVLLLSPEMLSTKGFQKLIENSKFRDRLCAFGVDEVHLVNTWGAKFRKCFMQLGYIRARLPSRAVLILSTASLVAGGPTENICRFFGLRPGCFHFLQRSNLRPDIRMIFRTLTKGLGGLVFPDLAWTLTSGRKTLIFATTITLGFRVLCYLRSLTPHGTDVKKLVRMYNSLNDPEYNRETLRIFEDDPACRIILATDTMMVGVNPRAVEDVIVLGLPDDVDEVMQKVGRANRGGHVPDARGIVYITKANVKDALASVGGKTPRTLKGAAKIDANMARMITALCKTAEQNRIYNNPQSDPPCSCEGCRSCTSTPNNTCSCSGCMPDSPPALPPKPRRLPRQADHDGESESENGLTDEMVMEGIMSLRRLRDHLYKSAPRAETALFPPTVYLPESVIQAIITRFSSLRDIEDLDMLIKNRKYVVQSRIQLWSAIHDLRMSFVRKRREASGVQAHGGAPTASTSETSVQREPIPQDARDEPDDLEALAALHTPVSSIWPAGGNGTFVARDVFNVAARHDRLLEEILPGRFYGMLEMSNSQQPEEVTGGTAASEKASGDGRRKRKHGPAPSSGTIVDLQPAKRQRNSKKTPATRR